jgi:hypothetical protein
MGCTVELIALLSVVVIFLALYFAPRACAASQHCASCEGFCPREPRDGYPFNWLYAPSSRSNFSPDKYRACC